MGDTIRCSGKFETTHGSRGGSEFVGIDTHSLQHGHKQIWQRIVALRIESQVLSMLEASSGKNGWQIQGRVSVRIAQIGSVNDHRSVQQRFSVFFKRLHSRLSW